jgi:hypothetical protein
MLPGEDEADFIVWITVNPIEHMRVMAEKHGPDSFYAHHLQTLLREARCRNARLQIQFASVDAAADRRNITGRAEGEQERSEAQTLHGRGYRSAPIHRQVVGHGVPGCRGLDDGTDEDEYADPPPPPDPLDREQVVSSHGRSFCGGGRGCRRER